MEKNEFKNKLKEYMKSFNSYASTQDGQWAIKGFIDIYRNIYTISSDTKIVSKILEIHLFPTILKFADELNFKIVLAEFQNYYPDITFVFKDDEKIKYAIDFKTTYRLPHAPEFCNGFTLGSHGKYFVNREIRKNIQFPYKEYSGHFCLGIIYSRHAIRDIDETRTYKLEELQSIASVIKDFEFFITEKWQIASDSEGSHNTANIGSIHKISDILEGKGMFSKLGEIWFDEYWMNYGKITVQEEGGKTKKIRNLYDFVKYKNGDVNLIMPIVRKPSKKGKRK